MFPHFCHQPGHILGAGERCDHKILLRCHDSKLSVCAIATVHALWNALPDLVAIADAPVVSVAIHLSAGRIHEI